MPLRGMTNHQIPKSKQITNPKRCYIIQQNPVF
jgi:hypothetical protein